MHQAEDDAGSDTSRDRGGDQILSMYVQKLGCDVLRYLPASLIPAGTSILSVMVFTRIFRAREYGAYTLAAAAGSAAGAAALKRFLPASMHPIIVMGVCAGPVTDYRSCSQAPRGRYASAPPALKITLPRLTINRDWELCFGDSI